MINKILKLLITSFILLLFITLHINVLADDTNECPEETNNRLIKRIEFIGLIKTQRFIVTRELENRAGETFNCGKWHREKARLNDLDIFANIKLNISEVEDGVDLVYEFKELPAFIAFPAVKKTDQTGLMIGPAITFLNLNGSDIRLDGYLRTAVIPDPFSATELLIEASSPYIGSLPVEYAFAFAQFHSYNALKEYDEDSSYLLLDFFHSVSRYFKLIYAAGFLSVMVDEDNRIFRPEWQMKGIPAFLSSSGRDNVPKVGTGLIIDTRDSLYHTHDGIYQEFRFSKFGGMLGGEANYYEYLFDFRGYKSFLSKHIFFLSMLGQYRPGKMGVYDFFHVGGANTLRTYRPDPLYFGQHEILGTIEYRHEFFNHRYFSLFGFHLYSGLQWIVGVDYARLWLDDDRLSEGRDFQGYFTGIHILLPGVERLRIEFGVHDVDFCSSSSKFGLTVGLFSKTSYQRNRVR